VTHGIVSLLNDDELEGVLAHELGHVKNRDTLTSSVAATLAGAITMLARMGFWASIFTGYGGDSRDERGGGGMGALFMLFLAQSRQCLSSLPSRARANTRPT
jgi:heat shock protein HtpX